MLARHLGIGVGHMNSNTSQMLAIDDSDEMDEDNGLVEYDEEHERPRYEESVSESEDLSENELDEDLSDGDNGYGEL